MSEPMFVTARMQLRPIASTDLDALVELDADPEVMRYISGGVPNSRELYLDEILPRMMTWNGQPFGFFSAWYEGAFAGWFHLRPSVVDANVLEVGYRLRRAVWGRGLATEGSRHLVRHAFDELDQSFVDACTHFENLGSMRVLQKCSMSEVEPFVHPRAGFLVRRFLVSREVYERRDW
jgi:RimJ/RimL family protein N-acetyltransferase